MRQPHLRINTCLNLENNKTVIDFIYKLSSGILNVNNNEHYGKKVRAVGRTNISLI